MADGTRDNGMQDGPRPTQARRSRAGLTAAICAVVVLSMVGASFAAVPLYRWFCQVTGFGGTTQRADASPGHVLDRTVTIRFDANVAPGLGWDFAPEVRQVRLKVGEVGEVAFLAENTAPEGTVGTAVFNVTPETVGGYFNKITCFCFSEQALKPGERVDMPVVFFVDPAIAEDETLDYVDTVTLSYTFFPKPTDGQPVAAARPAVGDGANRL